MQGNLPVFFYDRVMDVRRNKVVVLRNDWEKAFK